MASLWDTLCYGGHAPVYLQKVAAPCLLTTAVIVAGCALDTRQLVTTDTEHLGSSGAGGDATTGSSTGTHVRPPDASEVPDCTYSGGTVSPGCETLAKNAGFATDTDGWQQEPYAIELGWEPGDAGGSSASGSILVTNSLYSSTNDGINPSGGMQCLEVTPGAAYIMAGDVNIPDGQGDGSMGPYVGQAGLSIFFWRGEHCEDTTPTLASFQTKLVTDAGKWTHVAGGAVAPDGAGSMSIRLLTIKPFKEYSFKAEFDNVLLQQK
jgi:hypothetical protein